MNADLHMADELKNTGKGNLFVIFGEPLSDIDILPAGGEGAGGKRIQVKTPQRRGRLPPDHRRGPQRRRRRHRLLVHRHRLQRGELLRPARLLPRRERPLQGAQDDAEGRDRRRRVGVAPQRPLGRKVRVRDRTRVLSPHRMLAVDEDDELINHLRAAAGLRGHDPGAARDRRRATGAQGGSHRLRRRHALAGRVHLRGATLPRRRSRFRPGETRRDLRRPRVRHGVPSGPGGGRARGGRRRLRHSDRLQRSTTRRTRQSSAASAASWS